MTAARQWVSQYTITVVPEAHRWASDRHFFVTVERHYVDRLNDDHWAVMYGAIDSLTPDGTWQRGGVPHLFDLETALRLAREAAPDVTVNGMRAGDLQ